MISKCKSSELICEIGTAPETTTASNIGITDPTSGTYERYFEVDGVKYHHILALSVEKGMELVGDLDGFKAIFVDVDGNLKLTSEDTGFVQLYI